MQDAPHFDMRFVLHVKYEMGEARERPAAKAWDPQSLAPERRSGSGPVGNGAKRGFDRIDEAQRQIWSGLAIVKIRGDIDIDSGGPAANDRLGAHLGARLRMRSRSPSK